MPLKHKKKIKVELIDKNPYDFKQSLILREIKILFRLLKSKIVVTTHRPIPLDTKKNLNIYLDHGTQIKGMNLMDKNKENDKSVKDVDYYVGYSNFYNTVCNSCYGLNIQKYLTLGAPRNDYLFVENKRKREIKKKLKIEQNQKIIMFCPTHRDHISDKSKRLEKFISNLNFEKFNIKKFNEYLKKNNLKFILKPHPNHNLLWKKILKKHNPSNFKILFEEDLKTNKIKFYELLGTSDLLVTDYSSIYVDYLLINKPIIFLTTDIKEYRKSRGFLLEPYETYWTPGPKCMNQKEFEQEILKSLKNKKYYEQERLKLQNLFHKYKDDNASERVAEFIEKKLLET